MQVGPRPDQVQRRRADVLALPTDLSLNLAELGIDDLHVSPSFTSVQSDQRASSLVFPSDRSQPSRRVREEEHSRKEDDGRYDLDGKRDPPLSIGSRQRLAAESWRISDRRLLSFHITRGRSVSLTDKRGNQETKPDHLLGPPRQQTSSVRRRNFGLGDHIMSVRYNHIHILPCRSLLDKAAQSWTTPCPKKSGQAIFQENTQALTRWLIQR